ncbi:hypothetical protein [Actinosynnema mirum]|uniref:Uncharacterized protein n=1 Tax=Actinosynnema mirum (strain ATCC 29888 / DSM 43827 / JCM 3225 / NBRC 14064 / NCIMB 13271 / NRRL B-12336 / IMRU 3971 / 101) TaxID=446462 RepID=C6WLL2_ACTMD|nr:hypothetical protein [Actinosynnema mirum]ACU38405.1 hypothetical protein Amir_4567 [Actinosynnema mirum DSM 43827]
MSLGLVDHVMVSLVVGVPPGRLLAAWGTGATAGPWLERGRWLVWAGRERPGRVRLGVQRAVAGGPGWQECLLVWETWTMQGVRGPVARAVTAGGGRMLAVGGTPVQARVLHAEDGRVLAEVSALGGLRDQDPEHLLARAVDAAGTINGAGLGRFASGEALEVVRRVSGVDLDTQDLRALLECVEVTALPHEEHDAGRRGPGPGDVPVVPLPLGRDPHAPAWGGAFPGGSASGRLLP